MKLKGFTLAELMTTLAIVGLLATLTVPVIVHNTRKHHQQTLLRKGIETLNEAISINIAKGRGDLYTYRDKEGAASGIPEYLAQNLDTATGVKRVNEINMFGTTGITYFETKDGIIFIFLEHNNFGRTFGYNNPNNNARCGIHINHYGHNRFLPGLAGNDISPCPIIIDTNKDASSGFNALTNGTNIALGYEDPDEDGLECLSSQNPCNAKTANGNFIVYLTNDSVYVPSNVRKFLGDTEE